MSRLGEELDALAQDLAGHSWTRKWPEERTPLEQQAADRAHTAMQAGDAAATKLCREHVEWWMNSPITFVEDPPRVEGDRYYVPYRMYSERGVLLREGETPGVVHDGFFEEAAEKGVLARIMNHRRPDDAA